MTGFHFKTAEEVETAADRYFRQCKGELLTDANGSYVYDKAGNPIYTNRKPPTLSGLAVALGFSSREALLACAGTKGLKGAVSQAVARVMDYAEAMLFDKDCIKGAELSLKVNFGWGENGPGPSSEENTDSGRLSRLIRGLAQDES